MKTTSRHLAIVPGIAALALVIAGCGAANEGGGSDGDLSGTLEGAGATSQEKAQEAWTAKIQGLNAGLEIQYQPVGSTDGRSSFSSGGVAFAGTDSAMTNDDGELDKATKTCGSEPIQIPAYVSPIAVAFNLPGVETINMSPDTIAKIFNKSITTWNDPAIAVDNDGVDLPDTEITPIHRSDDSGTTKNFTDYLSQAAGAAWTYEVGDAFPVDGEAADGTSGVIQQVTSIEGGIGYADNSQVEGLGVVSVKVGDAFEAPSAAGAAKVVEVSPPAEGVSDVDMAVSLDRTTTEAGAYPVVLLSYLLACQSYDDAATEANVKGYLSYVVSTDGQEAAADAAGSAPLSGSTAKKAQQIVATIGE